MHGRDARQGVRCLRFFVAASRLFCSAMASCPVRCSGGRRGAASRPRASLPAWSPDAWTRLGPRLGVVASGRCGGCGPASSVAIIISPRSAVHTDGETIAEPEVHLVEPSTVLQLATDASNAWERLLASSAGVEGKALREHVEEIWTSYGLLPSRIRDRRFRRPVAQDMAS